MSDDINNLIYNDPRKLNKCFTILKKSSELTIDDFNSMYNILIKNLKQIFIDFKENPNDKKMWIDSIKNNEYMFVITYDKGKLSGFLEYVVKGNECFLSEIQIDDEHKGDKKTFKSLINKFYLNIIPNTIIKANINDENDKSKSVFTHIGMKKIDNKKYKISYKDLEKYIKKNSD